MSTLHKFIGTDGQYAWENMIPIPTDDKNARYASGNIVIGDQDNAKYFVFRYFRIEPGGNSTLSDFHAHDHGVFILHGRAKVEIEGKVFEVGPQDLLHISPWEHHQMYTLGDEPLGFLCIIPNKGMLKELGVIQ